MANNIRYATSSASYFEVLPTLARTVTPNSQEFEITGRGYEYSGLNLIIDITAVTSVPVITVTVDGVDRVSGKTFNLITSAALITTGTTVLKIGVGLTPAANTVVNTQLPPIFRITVTHGTADSATYSVGGMLV